MAEYFIDRAEQRRVYGARRLRQLADHLMYKVEDEEHNQNGWYCGTSACALGHAAMMNKFRDYGLKLVSEVFSLEQDAHSSVSPQFKDRTDSAAGAAFFDIDQATASDIFGGTGYSREEVVERIRKVAYQLETGRVQLYSVDIACQEPA